MGTQFGSGYLTAAAGSLVTNSQPASNSVLNIGGGNGGAATGTCQVDGEVAGGMGLGKFGSGTMTLTASNTCWGVCSTVKLIVRSLFMRSLPSCGTCMMQVTLGRCACMKQEVFSSEAHWRPAAGRPHCEIPGGLR